MNITVNSINTQPKGIFGINKTPSVIGWVPDGVVINGTVINEDAVLSGKILALTLPKDEINRISKGDILSSGIIENDICIEATQT